VLPRACVGVKERRADTRRRGVLLCAQDAPSAQGQGTSVADAAARLSTLEGRLQLRRLYRKVLLAQLLLDTERCVARAGPGGVTRRSRTRTRSLSHKQNHAPTQQATQRAASRQRREQRRCG
jgi:hypothetical protein